MAELWTDPRFPGIAARRATPEDLPALRALRSRMEGDYLPGVLEDWLREEPGGVYVYLCDGQVCGLASIHFPRPGEAWLRGKRIATGFEGRGIGTATAFFEIEEAARLGARVVRLMTHADNAPVHRMMARVGMEPVARWRVAESLPRPAGVVGAAAAGDGGSGEAAADGGPAAQVPPWAEAALLRPLQGGEPPLVAAAYDPWVLHELDAGALGEAARRGWLWVAGEPPAALLLAEEEGTLLLRRAAGEPAAVAGLVRRAAARAEGAGLELVASLPEEEAGAVLAALGLAQDAGEPFVVYARRLDAAGEGGA